MQRPLSLRVFGLLALLAVSGLPASEPVVDVPLVLKAAGVPEMGAPATPQVAPKTAYATPSCETPSSIDEDNLCQQRRIANAAERQADDSHRLVIYSAIGTLLLVLTLTATAIAAWGTMKAAKAAEAAVTSERAWVVVAHPNTDRSIDQAAEGGPRVSGHSLSINWLNSGRTPALNAQLCTAMVVLQMDAPLPPITPRWDEDTPKSVIGPGMTARSDPFHLLPRDFDAVRNRTIKIIFHVSVRYHTVHDTNTFRYSSQMFEFTGNGTDPESPRKNDGVGFLIRSVGDSPTAT